MDLSRVQVNCDAKCFATCTPKKDNRRPNLGWLSVSMLILVYCTMLSFFMFFAIPAHSIFLSLTRNSDPLYLFLLFFAIPNHSIYFFFILQFRSTPFFLQFRPTPFLLQFQPTPSFSCFYGSSPSVFSAALVLSETQIALQIIDVHSKHCCKTL